MTGAEACCQLGGDDVRLRLRDGRGGPSVGCGPARPAPQPQIQRISQQRPSATIPVPSKAPSSAAQYSDTSGVPACTTPGAGPLDQRLILQVARIQIMRISPSTSQLQHAALRRLQLGVILLNQPRQLRGTDRLQPHPRIEHTSCISARAWPIKINSSCRC